jgi:AcrR family transcriptional regulator
MTSGRPLRADALRNRARLLDAAEKVFADQGLAVPVEEIARQAGVGVGTVYRHFATKEELFAGVLVDRMEKITEHARSLQESGDPGEAFFAFLRYLIDQASANKALFEALSQASGVDLGHASGLGRGLKEVQTQLLEDAQRAGKVRDDIDATDLKALVAGCLAMRAHGADPERSVTIVFDGLRG